MKKIKKAIIIGATSGIGRELAIAMSKDGIEVGITGRRELLLQELKKELKGHSHIRAFDVSEERASEILQELIAEMPDVDVIVVNAGLGKENLDLDIEKEEAIVDVNCRGFTTMAVTAFKHFEKVGGGHIVGISSMLAIRATWREIAYSASKSYVTAYLEGLRNLRSSKKLPIVITDIKPGFVSTPMVQEIEWRFWEAPADKAARQLWSLIRRRKEYGYITRRWAILGFLMKLMPPRFLRWL